MPGVRCVLLALCSVCCVQSAAITQEPLDYAACIDCEFCKLCDGCMTSVTVVGTEFEIWPTSWNYEVNVRHTRYARHCQSGLFER